MNYNFLQGHEYAFWCTKCVDCEKHLAVVKDVTSPSAFLKCCKDKAVTDDLKSSQKMWFSKPSEGGFLYPRYPPSGPNHSPRDTCDGASAATGNHGNTHPPMSTPGLDTDPQQYSQMYLDAFNEVLPDMKNSIVGSVDGLCNKAISVNLMTHEEKAGILVDSNKYEQASRFLDSLAPKIKMDPQVLALLLNMLNRLGLGTCDQIVLRIKGILKLKKREH